MSLTTWGQSRREKPPELWSVFCQRLLGLSGTKTTQFWEALSASQWSRAAAIRSQVQYRAGVSRGLEGLPPMVHSLSPQVLIEVLESLITEGCLAPVVARRIEDAILQRTGREGGWR